MFTVFERDRQVMSGKIFGFSGLASHSDRTSTRSSFLL